ncbi:hypothetical protein PACTADRAFT_35307 [Pachysolen tannophilus NRRL Y-2460]|uniref:Uncharacterized protein n=1 Tax=Pachysolen tannophilus NRRL Y-2460 TaxID=669874 RepID=A0A1E4TS64_PACTA|nr:hypothetical protein PACTADRAFT_35307 [Pachysolen tannophilus NRRL Y-2460]
MDRQNTLLPLAFDISRNDKNEVPLSTEPVNRKIRDLNAGGTIFHTRGLENAESVNDCNASASKRRRSDVNIENDSYDGYKYNKKSRVGSSDPMLTSDGMDLEHIPTSTQIQHSQHQLPYKHRKDKKNSLTDFINNHSSDSIYPFHKLSSSPPISNSNMKKRDFANDSNTLDSELEMGYFNSVADRTFILPSSPTKIENQSLVNQPYWLPPNNNNNNNDSNNNNQFPLPSSQVTFMNNNNFSNPFFNENHVQSDDTIDFGIDRFGRVNGVQPLSEKDLDWSQEQTLDAELVAKRARDLLTIFFENCDKKIYLENLNLVKIPDEIEDFKDLVIPDEFGFISPVRLQIYLTHNALSSLSPCLFELRDKIEVLSLRDNKLKSLPGIISYLKNLKYLNVSSNLIQTLPHQLLDLNNLQTLVLRPNSALLEKEDFKTTREICPQSIQKNSKQRRFIGRLKYINRNKHIINEGAFKLTKNLSILSQKSETEFSLSPSTQQLYEDSFDEKEQKILQSNLFKIPKLTELCLREISTYKTSQSETRKWKQVIGKTISQTIAKALHAGALKETCSVCNQIVIQYVAEVIEWWDFVDVKLIPIRKQFCSGRCVEIWEREVKNEINENLELLKKL